MEFKILKEFGLSEREISVYTALLQIGQTTTGSLVKKSKVQNAKIYETLDKLISKGLVTFVIKGKIKHFQATNPQTLTNIFEEKRHQLNQIVKELSKIQNKKESQYEAKIYEGFNAIKSVFYEMYDILGKNSEYYVFPIGEQLSSEQLILFWSQVLHKQQQMRIKVKTLPNKKWKSIFDKHYKRYKHLTIRYTNQEFPTGIFIFPEHVLNILWGEKPVGFLVKSKENSLRWKKFFQQQWKKAKQ